MENILKVISLVKNSINQIAYKTDFERNQMLDACCETLFENADKILQANLIDIENAKIASKPTSFIDRLQLTKTRIDGMIEGLSQLKAIKSPIGNVQNEWDTKKELHIKKVTVPLGVIGIIFEARPNVTADTIGLAIKSGNAIVLRGGSDAINSNIAVVSAIKQGLEKKGFKSDFIGLIEDTTHEGVDFLLKQRKYIDVIIPRGGKNLIKNTIENSLIPTIETGLGNCHIYINEFADINTAKKIATSAKISRVSVCNSAESLVIDEKIANEFLPILLKDLSDNGVELRGGDDVKAIYCDITKAIDEDYYSEYNALIMSVKIVKDIDEAIAWINEHSTHHSDSIISENSKMIAKFNERIDSACVFHNTSTRFSDGF
ncbi:MAG: glutamate-5-semialdehyde dehydrogenase, partial [Clostridia bacterium]